MKSTDGKIKIGQKYAIQPQGHTLTWLFGLYKIEDGYALSDMVIEKS